MDESGFYLLPAVVRTSAPCGETPLLHPRLTRDQLSVRGALTPSGQLYTLGRPSALTGQESQGFLKHWLRQVVEKLVVSWAGSSIQWATEVKTVLAAGGAKTIHVAPLPGYAPDLNPVEGIWELLKYVELRNLCCQHLSHLATELGLAIRRLRAKPHLIQACFAGAGVLLH